MAKIILETRGLTKHYGGVHALDDANFILHEGEHVAVMGDNGAGKSTFVRQVTAVEQRTSGEIIFDGQPVHFAGPLEAREAGIETVFQTLALADDLDVPSNLFLGRELFRFQAGAVFLAGQEGDARPHAGGAEDDGGENPQRRQPDPQHVGRAAAMRGHRADRGLRVQAGDHG
jgi:fructose transport system ATP-binding protein